MAPCQQNCPAQLHVIYMYVRVGASTVFESISYRSNRRGWPTTPASLERSTAVTGSLSRAQGHDESFIVSVSRVLGILS